MNSVRLNLAGLITFSLFLVAGTALLTSKIIETKPELHSFASHEFSDPDQAQAGHIHTGPWGELLTQDIMLERPMECIAAEDINPPPETWDFDGLTPPEAKHLLAAAGLSQEQVESQTTPSHLSSSATNFVVTPDEDFLLSMKPETRRKIYESLYGMGLGKSFDYPCIYPGAAIQAIYADPRLNSADVALLKELVYRDDHGVRLTDYNLLIRKIPTIDRRMAMAKVLSVQPAALPRLCVRPYSDIDKIATYWARIDNVRFNDIRQVLEALKKLPDGGTISVVHLLPTFARSRLYTFPLPKQPDDPIMDCNWSTFNFDGAQPDNRYNDPNYMSEYLIKKFYQIDSPGIYGDLMFFTDARKVFRHSAVYIADDLYFNKYGYDNREPWIIAHFADIQAVYPNLKPVFYRRKVD